MASIHAMPFLVMNLGAEMIFILEQRLQAQSVAKEKSTRVMQDVLSAMFAPTFLDELMRPQHLYTSAGIREIFDNLAHASIMRLSENSMDKLYELMVTGTKQAFVTARHPCDLVEVSMNHFDALKALVGPDFIPLAQAAARFEELAAGLSVGELASVLKTLLTFFAAKKIKVTLFLQEKLQNPDGSFNIVMAGPVYQHPAIEAPGHITYFSGVGPSPTALRTEAFDAGLANGRSWTANPNGSATPCNPFIASQRTTTLGRNIFLTERKKDAVGNGLPSPASAGAGAVPTSSSTIPGGAAGSGASIVANAVSDPKLMRTKDISADQLESPTFQGSFAVGPLRMNTTTAGLNSLAGIAGASGHANVALGAAGVAFRLSNLFGEDDAGTEGAAGSDVIALPTQSVVKITAAQAGTNNELMSILDGFGAEKKGGSAAAKKPKTEEEDLLDLIS